MPSARDLLQKADSLMRSNRSVGASGGDETVPVLTDVVRGGEIPVLTNAVTRPAAADDSARLPETSGWRRAPPAEGESLLPLSEMPRMPQLPEEDSIIAMRRNESRIDRIEEAGSPPEERPKWLETDLLDAQPASASTADDATPVGAAEPEGIPPQPAMLAPAEAAPDSLDPPDPPAPTANAEEIAETVYFQVLQNLDLYTEHALQQHLSEHLPPIVEKASQELLSTLNANLGALMRQFVADAIEKQLGVRPNGMSPLSRN